MRQTIFAAAILATLSTASACPIQELTGKLQAADEHVAWFDFWRDIDNGESAAELGYATSDLRALADRLKLTDCAARPDAQLLLRAVEHTLASCVRWSKPAEVPATLLQSTGPHLTQSAK
jgi:hypothetical protein